MSMARTLLLFQKINSILSIILSFILVIKLKEQTAQEQVSYIGFIGFGMADNMPEEMYLPEIASIYLSSLYLYELDEAASTAAATMSMMTQ